MSVDYINYGEYLFCMNRIAYWLITNNKKFNTRPVYGYFGRDADYATIIKAIQDRGSKVELDSLIAEFVECAIVDNKDKTFLPNYVTCSDGKTKIYKDDIVDMANRVSAYEVKNGKSPNIVYIKNKSTLNPYLTNQGCSGIGQCTPYYCACNSLQQAFYRLTGKLISESTIASVAGTTTAGTSHQGINTAVAWFNRTYGYNIKIEWKNFSELGDTTYQRFKALKDLMPNCALFFHLLYRDSDGHYEGVKSVNLDNNTLEILNSLGSRCNYPAYCGYIETRSFNAQQSYINGISQKSLAILTI